MPVVVCDTSPIRALHHLGLTVLLTDIFGRVLIPPAVAAEQVRPRARFTAIDATGLPGFEIRTPVDDALLAKLRAELDQGEAEAIRLAVDVRAEAVIIDEAAGRAAAASLGLVPLGVVGLLVRAKEQGRIPLVGPLLDELRTGLRFYISDALLAQILVDAGEARRT